MKLSPLLLVLLTACSPLGSIPQSTMDAVANAGGGCVKAIGPWGTGVIMVGSADKGVIRNGEVVIAGDCGGITIRDAATVRAIAPTK